ncbi:MAG: GNAT family N-acetyltransferase [Gammaproteobacteria bacterium]|nr:GNAT family N-acetyltransferase [Gammaproteobacteria bacterium]MBV9621104.1 GNAT family N-acetyltransferase [Gammaproteobacteria bacterium]
MGPMNVSIRAATELSQADLTGLCEVLTDCVEGGDSVGFMLPMSQAKALSFWQAVEAALRRGARRLLLAEGSGGELLGTVQLVLARAENQPHRADLAKMLVRRSARRRGVGRALLEAAEMSAREAGRTVLVLDTASDAARRLYERCGWQRVGDIPGYALWPGGGACPTTIYYRLL